MKKFNLFLIFFMTTSRLVLGQMDINAVNKRGTCKNLCLAKYL